MRGPARLLIDDQGNPVGVTLDGTVYRLQVQAVVTDSTGATSDLETDGVRVAQAVSYPELLALASGILQRLDQVLAHLAHMNDEDDPL
jgi:hypothetical protein